MTTSNCPVKSQVYISTRFQKHMQKVGLGLFDSSQLSHFIKILFCNSRKYLLVYKNKTRKNRTIYPVGCCQVVVSWFERGVSHFCVLYPPKIPFHQSSIDLTTSPGVLPYKGLMGTCGQPGYSFSGFLS